MGIGLDENLPGKVENLVSVDSLQAYSYFPKLEYLSHQEVYRWFYLPFLWKNLKNFFIRLTIKSNNWREHLYSEDIKTFISFDNELLMHRLFRDVDTVYRRNNLTKPVTMHYGRFGYYFFKHDEYYLDKALYTIPDKYTHISGYNFPKMMVGYQGLYDVFKFLYQRNPDFSDLVKSDHFYLPTQVYRTIADELVYRLRNETRSKYNLGIYL